MNEPMLAPADSAGAKTPPALPAVNEKTEPAILKKGMYHTVYFSVVNKAVVIKFFPEPTAFSPKKKAKHAMMSAHTIKYKICWYLNFNVDFHL